MASVRLQAPTACISCRQRKQKCDKTLPQCARCSRLLISCHYTTSTTTGNGLKASSRFLQQKEDKSVLFDSLVSLVSTWDDYPERLCLFVRKNQTRLEKLARLHFEFSHQWLPIVDKSSFNARCALLQSETNLDFCALLLSMCLLNFTASDGCYPQELCKTLYSASKHLFASFQVREHVSLEILQAGVLLTYFEYGEGAMQPAWLTIRSCSSMAYLYSAIPEGFIRLISPEARDLEDERDRIWWEIYVAERLIAARSDIPLQPLHIRYDHLPINAQANSEIISKRGIEDEHQQNLRSLSLKVKAAAIMDEVLHIARTIDHHSPEGMQTIQDIDRDIISYMGIVLGDDILYTGSFCSAVIITINAFMCLHAYRLSVMRCSDFPEIQCTQSLMAVYRFSRIVKDMTEEQVQQYPDRSILHYHHPPYGLHMIYQMIDTIRILRKAADVADEKPMLRYIKMLIRRWPIAGEYVNILENE